MAEYDFDKVLSASKTEASKLLFLKSKAFILSCSLVFAGILGYFYSKSTASVAPKATSLIEKRENLPNISTVQTLPPPPDAVPLPPKGNTISIVDGRTGQSREVTIGAPATAKIIAITPSQDSKELPIIKANGAKQYELYAQAFRPKSAAQAAMPRIAIIIGGVGLDMALSQKALDSLPKEVTLAIAAPAPNITAFAGKARAKGNELLLQMPYETINPKDTAESPFTLKASLPMAENIQRLHAALTKLPAMIGVINYGGDKLMKTDTAYAPIIKDISERGLLVIDDASSQNLTLDIGKRLKASTLKVDAILNDDTQLNELEATAKSRGAAVGYVLLNPQSLEKLAAFIKTAEKKGILLVPLTATLSRKGL